MWRTHKSSTVNPGIRHMFTNMSVFLVQLAIEHWVIPKTAELHIDLYKDTWSVCMWLIYVAVDGLEYDVVLVKTRYIMSV